MVRVAEYLRTVSEIILWTVMAAKAENDESSLNEMKFISQLFH